ncbi:MAG: class B sortase [Oscillospiraceae bacterium]|nr:class B sortase [Oscillospiraceae bacterium]
MKRKLTDILIIILLCVMCFSGYKLYSEWKDSKESHQQFEQLENIANRPLELEEDITTVTATEKYMPIYNENNDFVAWITIDDSLLNYPVMQTKNEPEYYLRRDFTKKYNFHGVPFIDYRCTLNESDNIIVYSHNMKDGTMFSAVEYYMDPDYYENHRYIRFDTLDSFSRYEVICVLKIDVRTEGTAFYENVDFETEEDFNAFIRYAKSAAPYETGVSAEYGDELLTLSTCEYTMTDGRCVLIARKISQSPAKRYDASGNEIMK